MFDNAQTGLVQSGNFRGVKPRAKAREPAQTEARHQLVNRNPEMTAHDHLKQIGDDDPASRQRREYAFPERALSVGASSQEVAEVIAKAFQDIAQVLVPIIGQRGMAALYRRSLHLAGAPWAKIAAAIDAAALVMDTAPLAAELAKQTAANATTAGTGLLQVFYVLLATLIGESLSERLLRPVWANFLSGASAQGTKE